MVKNRTNNCYDEDMLKENMLMHMYINNIVIKEKVDDALDNGERTDLDLWVHILRNENDKVERVANEVIVDASFEYADLNNNRYDATEEIVDAKLVKISN